MSIKEPCCEDCDKQLTMYPDYSGEGRATIVCFDCEPPRIMCRACANAHIECRRPSPEK